MTTRARRARALTLTALVVPLVALTGAVSMPRPAAAADAGASVDHAQPTDDGGLQVLVSVPEGDTVDASGVKLSIGGKSVKATAVPASQSDAIERTSLLAIDTSDSMRGARIAEAKRAALTYLEAAPANVRVGVLTFDDTVRLLVPPGTDRAAARNAVAGLTLTHNTALYQGVLGAIDAVGDGSGQRRILVLSDGKDTTHTPLQSVLDAITSSGIDVDAVSLQQSDAESGPLREMAAAGHGKVLNALEPEALSAAFAQEAADLARQLVVTASVPKGTGRSADVRVEVPVGGSTVTASAYVRVREASHSLPTNVGPEPVKGSWITIPSSVVLGGVAAIGVGLLGVVIALAMKKPEGDEDRLADQLRAYGMYANAGGPGPEPDDKTVAKQATRAAEKALAANRSLEAKVAAKLEAAGLSLKPAEWMLIRGGMIVVGVLGGLLLGTASIVLGIILFLVCVFGPWLYLKLKRSRRLNAFSKSLPDTLQLMAGSLSAGLSLAQSIDTIVREGQEPITSEFKRVVVESRLGVTLEDSMEGVAERMQSRDFAWVVMAIRIQREVGGNLSELLLSVAETLREREYLRRQVRALSAEGRLSCYVLGGLPPAFLLYLVVTKPDYTHPMFSTPIGFILLTGLAILLGVGVFWMSRVSKVEV